MNTLVLKVKAKCFFVPSFLLVNCITASQSVLSMTRWVLTVLCRVFDPQAPGEGARAPGCDSDGAAEPKGPSVSHRSQMWAEHFLLPTSAKHSPDLGTPTNTMHRAVCTVREEQEHFTALPVWPRFTLTAQDKAKALRLCCVASSAVVSVKMEIWFHYCVSCLSVLARDNNFHKTTSCKHEMFYWCYTKGCLAVKNVSTQQFHQG